MDTNKGRDPQGRCVLEMIWSRMFHSLVNPSLRWLKGTGMLVLASTDDRSSAF